MIKMKQENYARKMKKMRCILFLNILTANKMRRFLTRRMKTRHNRHIEQKSNAATPNPAASSNYILSIILI